MTPIAKAKGKLPLHGYEGREIVFTPVPKEVAAPLMSIPDDQELAKLDITLERVVPADPEAPLLLRKAGVAYGVFSKRGRAARSIQILSQ